MLHIAEERLHAYVDRDRSDINAEKSAEIELHLGECEVCRAVVSDGIALRERANAILARSGPTRVVAPDFAAIQARADKAGLPGGFDTVITPRPTPRMQRSYVALAWAASLIAAVGLGWLTRDLFQGRDQVAVETISVDATRQEEAMSGTAPRVMTEAGDAGAVAVLPPSAGASTGATSGATAAVSAEAAASAPGMGVGAAQDASAPSAGLSSGPPALAAAPKAPQESAVRTRGVSPGDFSRVGVAGSVAQATAGAQAADAAAPPRPGLQERQVAAAAPPPPPAAREEALSSRSAAPTATAPATPQAAAEAPRWAQITRADAERRLGRAIVSIPEQPITRIEAAGAGGIGTIRLTQSVSGSSVTLLQSRGAQAAGQSGVTGLTRTVGDLQVTIEGSLPSETLRGLLARVR